MAKSLMLLEEPGITLLFESSQDKILVFLRGKLLMAFNFHPKKSHTDYQVEAPPGKYKMIFDSDRPAYGGHGRLTPDQEHLTLYAAHPTGPRHFLSLYLPARTGMVLELF